MEENQFFKKQGLYDPRFEHDSCGVGFVCNVKGKKTHEIIVQGLKVLKRLSHRGATGSDPKTGDGAGILIQIPHDFFVEKCGEMKIGLPPPGSYGTGLIFLPVDKKERIFCKKLFSKAVEELGQKVLGWREVPVDESVIGKTAKEIRPVIEQIFISRNENIKDTLDFERKLYLIRKYVENVIRNSKLKQKAFFYITNISCRTFIYKGLLMPSQLEKFFPDLGDEKLASSLCIVHSRYSTNTFPSWDLSQPFRFLAHNGEINTLRGNVNWMRAKEGLLNSSYFGEDIEKIKPVIVPGGSDSAVLDNVFELLILSGRSLPHAMMMLIPSAWEQDAFMDEKLRAFYQYHACLMEPWDGPAAVAFTDGTCLGAVLDRNGLRPARYIITRNDLLVMASEVGVLDIDPGDIKVSGRLEPGKMLYVDTGKKKVVDNKELKEEVSSGKPYGSWLKKNMVRIEDLPEPDYNKKGNKDVIPLLKAFGYTREDLKFIIKPMAENGGEAIGSMGNDTPHAVLSKRPQLVYNYFKQLFAQVTNPPIDPIREELVMSLECYMGTRRNLLDETPLHCGKLKLKHPILSNADLERIRKINQKGFCSKTISILFKSKDESSFQETLERICLEAAAAIKENNTFIILSDRGVNKDYAAIPALIAVGAVHQYLVKQGSRSQIALILESGEPRDVHHFSLLFAFGAGCVNPYMAFDSIEYMIRDGMLDTEIEVAKKNYINALKKGILKILSKMGISTLRSYRGAQIFEALGLDKEIIEKCFTGTVSRIEGAGIEVIAKETLTRHRDAYRVRGGNSKLLPVGGVYQWKKDGEFHLWNPESIAALQDAAKHDDYDKYKEFSCLINDQSNNPATLRSLLKFTKVKPVSIDEVESIHNIFSRFVTGAMSFGSISKDAHESIALAMNRIGGKSNTGEGGEDPSRFVSLRSGHSKRSAIKQIASGRFGVSTNYLVNADELQIKIAQGAKPGEGGQLPGHKVSVTIASTRYTTPGVTLISPPPHHDIYSIEDLAQLIFDLKNVNPRARISVKLVSEIGVGTVAAGVAKGRADMILISGSDGGTGASPRSSIMHAGLPWELGLSETHQTLVLNNLRGRVVLQTDGQIRTGRDIAIAALLGAEEYGTCSACLVILGCVMLRHCHLNNCSMGVATQDPILQSRFRGRPEYIVTYMNFVAQELREIMASLGIRNLDDMIGRTDFLEVNKNIIPWKALQIDFSNILYKPDVKKDVDTFCKRRQNHGIDNVLDRRLIKLARRSLLNREQTREEISVCNTNRSTGAMLSGEICRIYGEEGLPNDTIYFKFTGVAGQSFGAWLTKGVTFELEGITNDYIGKGISGGKIIIYPDRRSKYKAHENIIVGNTSFYGAISGEVYIRGIAGERFCVRNSGVNAVVEGVGDHGCEYMTGGRIVILGKTGRNFAAGMSGGIAYVFDEDNMIESRCNINMVNIDVIDDEDEAAIHELVHNHYKYTQSEKAEMILGDFKKSLKSFVKIIPVEYKRILETKKTDEKLGLTEISDG